MAYLIQRPLKNAPMGFVNKEIINIKNQNLLRQYSTAHYTWITSWGGEGEEEDNSQTSIASILRTLVTLGQNSAESALHSKKNYFLEHR
jgi:hypothetical protein